MIVRTPRAARASVRVENSARSQRTALDLSSSRVGLEPLPKGSDHGREVVPANELRKLSKLFVNNVVGPRAARARFRDHGGHELLDDTGQSAAVRFGTRRDVAHELRVE